MYWEAVTFDGSALIAGLFLLKYGANSFIENSALILEEIGISPTLSHLVTAGAEWEELSIVIASICQEHTSLGLGNIIGSSISNILGGLAVAMLMQSGQICFDSCAKFYSGASFVSASVFLILFYTKRMDFTGGLFCLVFFSVYIFAVGLAIWEGYLTLSMDDRDPDNDVEEEETQGNDEVLIPEILLPVEDEAESEQLEPPPPELQIRVYPSRLELRPSVCTPLLGHSPASTPWLALSRIGSILMPNTLLSPAARLSPPPSPQRQATSPLTRNLSFRILQSATNISAVPSANFQTVGYHLVRVGIGFLAVAVSGFVISSVAASLADRFKISGTVFGTTVLSIVLTIPEKFILVIVGIEGNSSILVASIAGSNVFHLTLCLGILFVAGGEGDADAILAANMLPFEVWVTWGCSILLLLVVWLGGRRWMGAILFLLYVAFNAMELTVFRR